MTIDLDIGPLSWVKSEIDLALERAGAALVEHAQNQEGGALPPALKQLHQAHGALTIVGLDGITEYSSALERLFERLASGSIPWSDTSERAARDGIVALRRYLDALMDGSPNQTLRLMPTYAALAAAAGEPVPGSAALFFPDLSQRPPRREVDPPVLPADKLDARLKMARMGFERGLLKWLKQAGDEARRGLSEMKNSVVMIEATQLSPADRAVWWVAGAFFEALLHGAYADYEPADDVRKMAMRVGAQIKHLSEGRGEVAERLMAELLYFIAIARTDLDAVTVVRAAYRLDTLLPSTRLVDIENLRPLIRRLRDTLTGAKDDWNKLCSGVAAALPPFHEKVTQAGEIAPTLGNAALEDICSAIVTLTDALRRDPSRHNDSMAIEVATALLLCDSALEHFESLDADFARDAQIMAGRLSALSNQQDLEALDIPNLNAMARRAQERLLLTTVAREIQINLVTVEQTLDAYFRDPNKLDSLNDLSRPLKQSEGALMILGQARAVEVLSEATQCVAALANGSLTGDHEVFESLAGKLSGIGFFVEQLEQGTEAPDIDAILAPRKAGKPAATETDDIALAAESATPVETHISAIAPSEDDAALMATSTDMAPTDASAWAATPALEATDVPNAPDVTDTPDLSEAAEPALPIPVDLPVTIEPSVPPPPEQEEAIDAELLDIFLEEAREVLTTISEQLATIHDNPSDSDALTTLRRSFHTLKGSGRMVDLNELGEAGWGAEQVMSLWVQEKRPASPVLLTYLDLAIRVFSAWVEQLASGGSAHHDASALNQYSAALLADTAVPESLPAPIEPAAADTDSRSLHQLLADMEAHDEAEAARKVEDELAAAELEVAEIAADIATSTAQAGPHAGYAVSPAPTSEDAPTDTDAEPEMEVPASSADAPVVASISDEELLAAELAAADIMAEGIGASHDETGVELGADQGAESGVALSVIAPADSDASADTETAPLESVASSEAADSDALELATPQPETPAESDDSADSAQDLANLESVAAPESTDTDDTADADSGAEILPFPTPEPVRIGDLEVSATLFAIYIEEAQQHMDTIRAEIAGTGVPSDNLIRAAHTLGSTSGTTGIEALHHLARALEVALGGLSIVDTPATEPQRLLLARCAGALEGMLGAVLSRRLPGEELELTAELRAMKPEPVSLRPTPERVDSEPVATDQSGKDAPTPSALITTATSELEFALPEPAPEESAAPPPQEEEEPEEFRHGSRLVDEIDEQLLPIFLEEATDLMASIDAQLRGWRGAPDNEAFIKQLLRDLHTIKGSARMAGAMGCGDLFHSMESRIEQGTAMRAVNAELFESLETSYDRGAMLIERLQRGEYGPIDAPPASAQPATEVPRGAAITPAATTANATGAVPDGATTATGATTAAAAAGHTPKAQIQLRVRADLVDSLVNEAGEMAIARARIEGEMRALKTSLLELTDNVIRLRQQVREIEIQAETQMASQITELKAQAEIEGRTFDPLEFDRFTRFQELTRSMAESVNDVSTVQHSLLNNVTTADASLSAQSRINRELSQRLMGVRMMPFESLAERLHRVVRQAAKDVGKRANLDIKGGQMGIDRSVLEHIGGPLEHLLRNSVAHGVEDPATREANGKPGLGQITLSLAQEGNDLVLALADDGAGLNLKRIRQRAVERGLMNEDDPTDDAHLIGMIFQSGFSTAEAVSAIAGRGVGMDVVKTEIEGLGGRIEVTTTAGKGSVFRLYLPLTLAVSQAVIVLVGHRSYALPASMVEQVSELKPDVIAKIRAEGGTEWQGRHYPYRYLSQLLGMRNAKPQPARRHWLLLIKGGAERLAIEIDGMIGNREIVIKNLGQQLRRIPGLAGATVLGNGEIGLILNPIALYAKQLQVEALAQQKPGSQDDEPTVEGEEGLAADALASDLPAVAPSRKRQPSDATVMVVDDSLTVRKVTGRLLGRHGYQVVTAKDGVDALEQLGDIRPDVMLVDIEMPRMDGFELTRNIRADYKLKDIPIIMITSRSADKHRQYANEIGVNCYLGKPYNEEALLGHIESFVNPPAPGELA